MTTQGPTRVGLISHDWSTQTGAGRCAVELEELLRQAPEVVFTVGFEAIPERSRGRAKVMAKVMRALRAHQALRRTRTDVVIVNTTVQASIVLASRIARARVIWWCHESPESLGTPLMRLRLAIYRRLAHSMVYVSSDTPRARMPQFAIRNITIGPASNTVVAGEDLLVLGTKCTRKGTDRLVELVGPVLDRGNTRLRVVGDEDPRDAAMLASTRAELLRRWPDSVIWLEGVVDPEPQFAASAVLLLPSRADPRPRVVEEALSRGIPVVASVLPGLLDVQQTVLRPGALTLVSDTGDWPEAIWAARKLGRSSTTDVQPFTPEEFTHAWLRVVREAVQ